ncbi:MAG: manganese catalase family protein [Turicibacter sp.]|nr:manganese catalase family protein [Turicibacter sp.]
MWVYEKRLAFPVDVKKRDLKMAKCIYDALGGPAGELSASMQYLHQRFTMPTGQAIATLTDIGTEELGHLEMVATLIYQLTDGASPDEIRAEGMDPNHVGAKFGINLLNPDGNAWTAAYTSVTADPITDLTTDMSAEERARAGYEMLMTLTTDEDVQKVLNYLRTREVVHYQRFGETLNQVHDHFDHRNIFI